MTESASNAVYIERVHALQHWLKANQLDALVIPHEDEFLGEYLPAHNERLHWATGFTGSAGAAIITQSQAVIFVDGRYTVQVRKEAPAAVFSYCHLIEQPPLTWLQANLAPETKIALDPRVHSAAWLKNATAQLQEKHELHLLDANPIDALWHDRPQPVLSRVKLMPLDLVGVASEQKRQQVASEIQKKHADAALVTQLDSICWLLNIRGSDISRLPVLLTTAMIEASGELTLFIDAARVPANFAQHAGAGVHICPPEALAQHLASYADRCVLIDPNTTNAWLAKALTAANAQLIEASDLCLLLKAAKNEVEIAGMQTCHIRDGVAVSRFLAWLDAEVAQGKLYDEGELADKLFAFRQQDQSLVDLSFDTISAAGSNAAMCHYHHHNQPASSKLELNNVYLVDSGGQYPDGTTDITRTVAIGECPSEIKQAFTLVLKGHIALAQAKFPQGTTGSQLDALARQYLWAHGFDYDHGTGHGVGHFLNVHEGPQRIAKVPNQIALLPGMVLSNEPGYYRANQFGIRIENLELVSPFKTAGDSDMLGFQPLTLVPMDKRLVDVSLLTVAEMIWWNEYHYKVWHVLSPLLDGDDLAWLKQATAPLSYAQTA